MELKKRVYSIQRPSQALARYARGWKYDQPLVSLCKLAACLQFLSFHTQAGLSFLKEKLSSKNIMHIFFDLMYLTG